MEQPSSLSGYPRAGVEPESQGPDTPDRTGATHPVRWLAAATLAFAANLVLHLPLTELSDALVERLGWVLYNDFLGWSFLLLGICALVAVSVAGSAGRPGARLSIAGLVALAVLADRLLLVANIENIHYPQYALLAVLLARSGIPLEASWLAATILGVGDEAFQYLVLRRGTPSYLDWNDIVFNAIGAAFGVVLWCRHYGAHRASPICSRRTMTVLAASAVAVGMAIAPPRLVPFFEAQPFSPRFHILTASDGVLVVSLLWVGVRALLARARRP